MTGLGSACLLIAVTTASPAAAAGPEERPERIKIAVLDLRSSAPVSPELAGSLGSLIAETLDATGAFKAISMQEIKQMLALEQVKQMLGCDDVSCLAELGGALGAEYMVSGSVLLNGGTYLVQLQLANIPRARVDGRTSREYKGGADGLAAEIRAAAKVLVRELLAQKSGTLALTVSQEGATVRIDGSIIGSSPVAPFEVAGGMHMLEVEKEGFVRYRKDVEITSHRESQVAVTLTPSGEYLRTNRVAAERTRSLALSCITAGVVATALGGGMYFLGAGKASDLRDKARAYNDAGAADTAAYDEIKSGQKELAVLDVATVAAAGIGLAALTTGVLLYRSGDDPATFTAPATASHSGRALRLIGLPGGVALVGSF